MSEKHPKGLSHHTTSLNIDLQKNSIPGSNIQLLAESYDHAMYPRTTVLMRLSQFHTQKLHGAAADFDKKTEEEDVKQVWWSFHDAFGTMPTVTDGNGEKARWGDPTEEQISNAWVRG